MTYRFECAEEHCRFSLRSDSSDEVERLVRAHVRTVHNGRIDQADLERRMEQTEPA